MAIRVNVSRWPAPRQAVAPPRRSGRLRIPLIPDRPSGPGTVATTSPIATGARSAWRDYFELSKPRVVALIVFTAVVGMFLAVPGMPPLNKLIFGTLGIGLASGCRRRDEPSPGPAGGCGDVPHPPPAAAHGAADGAPGAAVRPEPRHALDVDAHCAGEHPHGGAHLLLAHRLRRRLHRVPEARLAAEHRHRRRRRRCAAAAGLDRGHAKPIRARFCSSSSSSSGRRRISGRSPSIGGRTTPRSASPCCP